jgi:hypothetical protein
MTMVAMAVHREGPAALADRPGGPGWLDPGSRIAVLTDCIGRAAPPWRHRPEGITSVDNAVPVSAPPASPETPASPTPPRQRPGAGTILTLVNGVLAGVGGVYVSTHSVLITVIATVVAIVLTVMVLIAQW